MSVVEVQPMPPGYTLVVTNGNGWQSFGWVLEYDGETRAVRHALGSPARAAGNAWKHSRLGW